MRLFTALDPSPEVQERLVELLDRLRPSARLRWTKPENLHLTLKFIGEYPDAELGALQEAMREAPWPGRFEVRVAGLGFFPNDRAPRVFWAGIQAGKELAGLARAIDEVLLKLGVPAEGRPYSPHLTLARIENRTPLERLHRTIRDLGPVDLGSFRPDRFYLYRSQPGPGGSVYTRLAEFGTTL